MREALDCSQLRKQSLEIKNVDRSSVVLTYLLMKDDDEEGVQV